MPSPAYMNLLLLSFVAGIFFCRCGLASTTPDTTEKYHWCNKQLLQEKSNEAHQIFELLGYAVDNTARFGYNSRSTFYKYVARASCRTPMSADDCTDCLDYADNMLYEICGFANGGQITLADCRLRFEQYEFDDNW
ncbi:hypothetical protein MLD38_021207 [Melastoma candidum]|uniref:Uncharacterized protein n=1 Tax=Melastoma candidum TaxID=119954 RepID=A0ACB9QFF9_9MYRT|nr:hypothetical protein MLD38_021207 [Melastoma candidum]